MRTKVLVTGVAGFIGSNLAKELVKNRRILVVGIDSLEGNYPRWIKKRNIEPLKKEPNFKLLELNLLHRDLSYLLREGRYKYIFHQAATPGVRSSWGEDFVLKYIPNNVVATFDLLEASKNLPFLRKFIYASSSSVYGEIMGTKLSEEMVCRPFSPYGVSKFTAEQLCHVYFENYKVPTISLRYFSVYGPGQRPDMAFHGFIKNLFEGNPLTAHDGEHARDFTYIGDVVQANILAQEAPAGEIFNVGGGSVVPLIDVIQILEEITDKSAQINWVNNPPGNVRYTEADLTKSRRVLGYKPKVGIREGLANEVKFIKGLYDL